ncbi:MAG: lipase family protein [Mycobacterium sp.]
MPIRLGPRWSAKAMSTGVAVLVMIAAVGCAQLPGTQIYADVDEQPATSESDSQGPGSLVETEVFHDVDVSVKRLGATAVKIVYRSTSGIDGSATEVSGTGFVPAGRPPTGGWPVIALAHGTTGISPECAPSLSTDLLESVGLVAGYLQLGYAVTVADYQGLGAPGAHPYLDAKTAGMNVIDSVRALRKVSKNVSTRWAVMGGSQGGGASWAANEQASTYGDDLDLVGAVVLGPMADMTGMAYAAAQQRLTRDQMGVYIWMLMGIENTRPEFPIDQYRHGVAEQKWDVLRGCSANASRERVLALFELEAEDLVPSSPESTERLAETFREMALPQQRGAAPMLVIYGGSDTYVDPEWTRAAIGRACAMGTKVAAVLQPEKGHLDLDIGDFAGWLMGRMEGLPPPDTCFDT